MDIGKEIIKFTKDALSNISVLDNIIDKAIEPFKDYTDTLGDIASPIKSILTIFNLKKRLTLKIFVVNYAKQLSNNYVIDEKENLKLHNFFKDKKNVIYISEIIDSAINSKSLKATAILGAIAGKLIKEKDNLQYDDLSIIETLRTMTDYDIENFITLYEYLHSAGASHEHTNEYRTKDFYEDNNPNKIHIDRSSLEFTIEKLKRTNGLTYNAGGIGQSGKSKGSFEMSNTTYNLYSIIKRTKVPE